uniref:ATP-dependent translocase ABCB1-like n=1 Tax=Styela clava TaxID=7725 RepID=UPI00193A037E|nr:ATP-dependent translocase ABCB1-like [Styela clava]
MGEATQPKPVASRDGGQSSSSEIKKNEPIPTVPYYKLYRFADGLDYLLVIIGLLAATIHGSCLPLLFVFFGDLTNSFTEFGKYAACNFTYQTCVDFLLYNGTQEDFDIDSAEAHDLTGNSVKYVFYFVYIACGVFVCATLQVSTFCYQAVRQSKRIRVAYVRAILRQDIGYHDVTSSGELNARLADDVKKIQDGMADKVSLTVQYVCMVLAGFLIAFIYSWKLSLVALSISPFLIVSSALIFTLTTKYTTAELDAYANAGSIAEETISSIRTVVAFGIQEEQANRYGDNLGEAKARGIKKGVISGASIGFLYFTMFGMYALTFWYGVTLVIDENDPLGPGDMMVVFFNILIGASGLGTSGSNMEYFSAAMAAGQKVFAVIDRIPPIDVFSDKGQKPKNVNGEIEFKNVRFNYPSRAEVEVLKGVSFTVEKGQTVALVGQSGCGKSTSVSLIQRFYDIVKGDILVDGNDIKKLNVKWLRDRIGVVAQEPILFDTTIGENIRWGREGVTEDEIIKAARQANAFDFINVLPKKFDTLVGESGGQMSGGQKQRIAIARAIVRDPKIMLLDEATSALDTESESIVQQALDKAAAGRTTIVIAHRLSTIKNADKIVAFQEGEIAEIGTHDELLKNPDGIYKNLINMQVVNTNRSITPPPEKDGDNRFSTQTSLKRKSSHKFRRLGSTTGFVTSSHNEFSGDKDDGEGEIEKEDLPDAPFTRIMQMNKPEGCYIGFGCIFAAMAGSVDPVNAILFASVLTIFTEGDVEKQQYLSVLHACLFLGLGVVAFIAYTMEATLFSKSGMELTTRLRRKAFESMVRQDISYFDDHKHSTGALCSRLATDASRVQGCTGVRMGTMLKNFCSLGVALGIAFAYGWKLTLLTIGFVPFLMIGGFLEMALLMGQGDEDKQIYEEASKIVTEAVNNIRTVASLTKEEKVFQIYNERLEEPAKSANQKALITGLGYGFSQCVIYFAYAGIFRLGIYLVEIEDMSFEDVFKVLTAVIFGAMAVGQNSSFAPDAAEAQVSAARMFKLFDSKPIIDAYSDKGHKPHTCKGNIEFKSLDFTYPTRPDTLVLEGLDVSVPSGSTLALVGQSGCGKSTCIQLIERFYDVVEGGVMVDGSDVKTLNVAWMRQQMGIVSQEPVLFNISIKENILLGDKTRSYTDKEVSSAAAGANIHEFISGLPEGYNTKAGAKGGQLSGGQKQRIAIARALLRKPTILLLDEATSALDTESEKIVQEALDKAREGRTSIIIAHRLSTVKNADIIAVVDKGKVVETGTHEELLKKRGAYYSLVNAQLTHQ